MGPVYTLHSPPLPVLCYSIMKFQLAEASQVVWLVGECSKGVWGGWMDVPLCSKRSEGRFLVGYSPLQPWRPSMCGWKGRQCLRHLWLTLFMCTAYQSCHESIHCTSNVYWLQLNGLLFYWPTTAIDYKTYCCSLYSTPRYAYHVLYLHLYVQRDDMTSQDSLPYSRSSCGMERTWVCYFSLFDTCRCKAWNLLVKKKPVVRGY